MGSVGMYGLRTGVTVGPCRDCVGCFEKISANLEPPGPSHCRMHCLQ